MHDPCTVAHEIKSPFRSAPSTMWPKGYRNALVTIWHVDPEDRRGMCGVRRADDTCGWFTPPYTQEARDKIVKVAAREYGDIWGKQRALAEGKNYARVCFVPTVYDAIYWTWRAIKYAERKSGWKYGEKRPALTPAELEQIYMLASNPIDNLRLRFDEVKDAETCASWFLLIYGQYLRHHRPWYKHPRWHFWHWRFQVHHWQTFRRWAFSRCAGCGKGFTWGYSPISHSWDSPRPKFFCSEVGIYHSECSGMTMKLHNEPSAGTA